MKRQLPIPWEEQLQAVALGVGAIHMLIEEFVEKNQPYDPHKYITVNRDQLAAYFREHPQIAEKHLLKSAQRPYHDMPVLESLNGKYRVAWMHHGEAKDVKNFDNLFDAATEYIMYSW